MGNLLRPCALVRVRAQSCFQLVLDTTEGEVRHGDREREGQLDRERDGRRQCRTPLGDLEESIHNVPLLLDQRDTDATYEIQDLPDTESLPDMVPEHTEDC